MTSVPLDTASHSVTADVRRSNHQTCGRWLVLARSAAEIGVNRQISRVAVVGGSKSYLAGRYITISACLATRRERKFCMEID
jgi:hypothetical protein